MRTALSPEVSVFNIFSPRVLALAAFTFAATAAAQVPANDLCTNATVLPVVGGGATTVSAPVTRFDLAAAASETPVSCISSKNSVWFAFTAPTTGSYRLDTCGSSTNLPTFRRRRLSSRSSIKAHGGMPPHRSSALLRTNIA
jgi:hypothetical protein